MNNFLVRATPLQMTQYIKDTFNKKNTNLLHRKEEINKLHKDIYFLYIGRKADYRMMNYILVSVCCLSVLLGIMILCLYDSNHVHSFHDFKHALNKGINSFYNKMPASIDQYVYSSCFILSIIGILMILNMQKKQYNYCKKEFNRILIEQVKIATMAQDRYLLNLLLDNNDAFNNDKEINELKNYRLA